MIPHTKNSRFNVNAFMKARKEARQKAVEQCRSLKAELSINTRKINTVSIKCRLQIGFKMQTRYKMQTADWVKA